MIHLLLYGQFFDNMLNKANMIVLFHIILPESLIVLQYSVSRGHYLPIVYASVVFVLQTESHKLTLLRIRHSSSFWPSLRL